MLSISPAHAATVSQAQAQAISLNIGGQAIEIESVLNEPSRAVNDGSTDVVTAAPKPLVAALDGQRLAITGALGQGEVAKRIEDTANKQYPGHPYACAGNVSNARGSPVPLGDYPTTSSDTPDSHHKA